ncbi:hypothetical protein PHAVU_003G009800 [Phaseolus vulgaris]|uniref:Putative plant transposon protein domain-containing protein n=1 Tax=Phaseolus vulgaris TaxID=3885 RepID=V7C795_PHAVU|nr:hypothetical protein PHAVU_003G009800g [Phaseolus vulgaris]ESW25130.1 hypothetical protein PHAVU_003G009800g [Phaseolus vulgaris]
MEVPTFFTGTVQGMSPQDATLHVEHQLALQELDERGLEVSVDLERCGIRGFFLEPQTIHPELIRKFWKNAKLVKTNTIVSTVLGREAIVNQVAISEAINCDRVSNCFYIDWEEIYSESATVEQVLYGEKFSENLVSQKVDYKMLCVKGKIWQQLCNKSLLPKHGSKNHVTEYGKFVIYHLLAGIPFNLPHLLFLNLLRMLKKVGEGMVNIPYTALVNRLLWHQGIYKKFYKVDHLRRELIAKAGCIVKQPIFSVVNLRQMQMGLALELQKVPDLPVDALIAYRLDNLKPPHLGPFESFKHLEGKLQKFVSEENVKERDRAGSSSAATSPSGSSMSSGPSDGVASAKPVRKGKVKRIPKKKRMNPILKRKRTAASTASDTKDDDSTDLEELVFVSLKKRRKTQPKACTPVLEVTPLDVITPASPEPSTPEHLSPIQNQPSPHKQPLEVPEQESSEPEELSQHMEELLLSLSRSSPARIVQDAPDGMFNTVQQMIQQALRSERDAAQQRLTEMEERMQREREAHQQRLREIEERQIQRLEQIAASFVTQIQNSFAEILNQLRAPLVPPAQQPPQSPPQQ